MRSLIPTALLLMLTLPLSSLGCAGNSGGGASDPGGTGGSPVAGTWVGTWLSSTGVGGTEVLTLSEEGGSVSGSVSFTGSPCFANATVDGTISGDALTATVSAGEIMVTMVGTLTGDQLSGTFDAVAAGACTGSTGTLTAMR